jgi:hypothetical protein
MENQPTKSQLLESIQNDYQAWQGSLAQLDDARMVQVKIGDWTIKDIIAHITWHENEMVNVLRAHALVGSPWWDEPTDQRNRHIFEQYQGCALDDVRQEAGRVHGQMVQLLELLPEADLYDPGCFPGMPPDWQPCELIVQNTYEHYQHHLRDLKAYLE